MAQPVTRLRVFVASPGDTQEERECLAAVIEEINRGVAEQHDLFLELVRWETHVRPGMGTDAQAVVNQQLPEADVVIGIFWKRLGTPTPRAESGTAEELEQAVERWRAEEHVEILTYFNQQAFTPRQEDVDQLERLWAFREKLKEHGMLVWTYDGVSDFQAQVREHLTAVVRDWPKGSRQRGSTAETAPLGRKENMSPAVSAGEEVRADREGDVQAFASRLRKSLLGQGFGAAAGARAVTVVLELLANVREHSESTAALVEVEVREDPNLCVAINVIQRGPAFDLEAAVAAGIWAYQQGDREHGLAKVARLASHLREEDLGDGRIGIECTVYDPPPIGSAVFDEFDVVTPVYLEFDIPKRWRLGPDVQVGRSLEDLLHFVLTKPAPRLMDLIFGGIRIPQDGYLGIEFAGHVVPSEVAPLPIAGEISSVFPQTRSEHVVEAALEARFNSYFRSGRVVMHAYETAFNPTENLREWAKRWGVPCFTDAGDLRAFLGDIAR